jgi:hypothetical protein
MVKNGHKSPYGCLVFLLSPFSVHALKPDLNARRGFLTILGTRMRALLFGAVTWFLDAGFSPCILWI